MPEKRLTAEQSRSLRELYFILAEPLLKDLRKNGYLLNMPIVGEKKPMTVSGVIRHIEKMTPVGLKTVKLFAQMVSRISEIKKEKRKKRLFSR